MCNDAELNIGKQPEFRLMRLVAEVYGRICKCTKHKDRH
jgi:hypothetical protein